MSGRSMKFRNLKIDEPVFNKHKKSCKSPVSIIEGIENDYLVMCQKCGHVVTIIESEVCPVCEEITLTTDLQQISEEFKMCVTCHETLKNAQDYFNKKFPKNNKKDPS